MTTAELDRAVAFARETCSSVVASEAGYGRRHSAHKPQIFMYAPLEVVVETARSAMAGAGLVPTLLRQNLAHPGVAGLVYLLSHPSSGESREIERAWPLLEGEYNTTGQRLAATLSHAKRHMLLDLLDIVVVDFDTATGAPPTPAARPSHLDLRPSEMQQLADEAAAEAITAHPAPALTAPAPEADAPNATDTWRAFVEWRDQEWELRKAVNPAAALPGWPDIGLMVWGERREADGDSESAQLARWLLAGSWKTQATKT
jgi:hypothetical protein